MKFRVLAFVLVLIVVVSTLSVSAVNTYETKKINIYYDGVKIEQEVIVDGGTVFAPISWLTYFGLMEVEEKHNEYEIYYPEQKEEKTFARRIFISKDAKPLLQIGYYDDSTGLFDTISGYYSSLSATYEKLSKLGEAQDETKTKDNLLKSLVQSLGGTAREKANTKEKYTMIYSDEFSQSLNYNDELYLPITEVLPLINAKVGVSDDGAICISPNNYSLLRVLYECDIASDVFDIDEALPGWQKHTINIVSYSVSTVFSKLQRLDFVSNSGEVSDYKDIFTDFLTDDETYLSAVGNTDERKAAEYIATTTKDLNTVLKTIKAFNIKGKNSSGEEIRVFEMFADTIYSSHDKEYYVFKEFDGITKVVGVSAEAVDYLYTYASQVEDHSKMLNAVYNSGNYSSGKDTARIAAYTVEKSFDESYTTAAVSKVASTVYDKTITKGIEQLPKAIASDLFTAIKSTGTVMKWIPSTKKALKMMDENVALNYYHDIAKDSYSSYVTNIFDKNLTSGKLEDARLSLLMAMLASQNAYSAEIFENIYSEKIESIRDTMKLLYLAADGTECEGADYYSQKVEELNESISEIAFVESGANVGSTEAKSSENSDDAFFGYTVTSLVDEQYSYTSELENNYNISIRLPFIEMDSQGAEAVNNDILEVYGKEIEQLEDSAISGYDTHLLGLDYEYSESNGVLSVLIKTQVLSDYSYKVYNLDLRSGNQLSSEGVLNALSLTQAEVLELLETSVESAFYANVPVYEEMIEMYEECYENSVSDDNLAKAEYFVKTNKLYALVNIWTLAGQGRKTVVVEVMSI